MRTEILIKSFLRSLLVLFLLTMIVACKASKVSMWRFQGEGGKCVVQNTGKSPNFFFVNCADFDHFVELKVPAKNMRELISSGGAVDVSSSGRYADQIGVAEAALNGLLIENSARQSDGSNLPKNDCISHLECKNISVLPRGNNSYEIFLRAASYTIVANVSPDGIVYDYVIH